VGRSDLAEGLDGATDVDVFATHAIFSDGAEQRLAESGLRIFTTNSIVRSSDYANQHKKWLTIIPVEELLAEAVPAVVLDPNGVADAGFQDDFKFAQVEFVLVSILFLRGYAFDAINEFEQSRVVQIGIFIILGFNCYIRATPAA
jgi:hypothetical protein